MADGIAYNINIRKSDGGYASYDIGAEDENVKTNTNNDNNFLINTEAQKLSNTLPLKFNKETISSNKDFNTINRTGYYDIAFNITANKPPFSDNTTVGSSLLVLNNIQIAFKGSEVYTRSDFSGVWAKGLGTDFVGSNTSTDGIRGLVPKPTKAQTDNYYLKSNGSWTSLNGTFARLGADINEDFNGRPTFKAGFKSEGTSTSIFENSISITAEDSSDNKALSVDYGISAGGEISAGSFKTTDGGGIIATGKITGVGIESSNGINITGGNITSTNASISTTNGNISAKTLNITSGTNINDITSAFDDTECAAKVSGGLYATGKIKSDEGVYGAVWNDLADSIPVDNEAEIEPGYCYCIKNDKYLKSSKYMDTGIIGIHSDTYGFQMGGKPDCKQLDCAVSGFVLAYVDKEYLPGTALTCTKDGRLTKMKFKDKQKYPERIVATYWKDEPNEEWGSNTRKIKVNGRKWVKIK